MTETNFPPDRVSFLRIVTFWTFSLSALLTVSDDFSVATAPGRFFYWAAHIGTGLIIVSLVTKWLQRLFLSRLNEWLQLAISSIVAVTVFAPIGMLLDLMVPASFGPAGHADLHTAIVNQGIILATLEEIGAYAPTVVTVWLLVHLSYRFVNVAAHHTRTGSDHRSDTETGNPDPPAETSDAVTNPDSSITDRIPQALGLDIVLIRADANYVHVHTTLGKTMFLYSLTKASEELGNRGLLVHRSYWLSLDHVQSVKRSGNKTICLMSDGTTVPVSRRRQHAIFDYFGKDFVRRGGLPEAG